MTRVKLDLHDLLVDALGGETTDIPATVQVSELLEFNDIHECEQDLRDILHDNRLIADIWAIEDVRSVRADLSDDQAWTVLEHIERHLDPARGITWDSVDQAAYDLFGSGHRKRVERCDSAIKAYNDDLPESNLIDFLADALHWCKAKGHDFDKTLDLARVHFDAETPNE